MLLMATIIFTLPLSLSAAYLFRAREWIPYGSVVEDQSEHGYLWGPAVFPSEYAYKRDLVKVQRPELLILGSSRVVEIRSQAFNVPTTNAGRAMRNAADGTVFLEDLFSEHVPKAVLIGLDFVWFVEPNQPNRFADQTANDRKLTRNKIDRVVGAVRGSDIGFAEVFRTIATGRTSNPILDEASTGLGAALHGRGYRSDGSLFYGNVLSGNSGEQYWDYQFRDILDRVVSGRDDFEHDGVIQTSSIDAIENIAELLAESGVQVWFFAPPLAPTVYDRMVGLGDSYEYLFEIDAAMNEVDVQFFNFTDPDSIQTNDCEFIDGFHGGEVTMLRVIERIAEQEDTGQFKQIVNLDAVRDAIDKNSGRTLVSEGYNHLSRPETDFLGLGCQK